MSVTDSKVVVITGTSSGIGKALAVQLATKYPNFIVYATLRAPESDKGEALKKDTTHLPNIHIAALDVTSDDSVNHFAQQLLADQGRLDILINNAGLYVAGSQDSYSVEDAQKQFNTNLFGIVRVQKAFFPTFRKQKSGHLIAVSSVVGSAAVPFADVYVASKFAVEGLYESLAPVNQLFGLQTTLIQPGPVITDIQSNSTKSEYGEDLKPWNDKYSEHVKALFAPPVVQTVDESLVVVLQAIEDGLHNKASLRYQTSEWGQQLVSAQLKDPTGNAAREYAVQQYFSK